MEFKKEKQSVPSSQLLMTIASGDDINLRGCTITGPLDINRLFDPAEGVRAETLQMDSDNKTRVLILPQRIVFDSCIFEENVSFTADRPELDNAAVVFSSDIFFNSSQFKAQARFKNVIFKGAAGFDGCHFEAVAIFKNIHVEQEARFRTVAFNGYCLFSGAQFNSSARFTNSHFAKGVNFEETRFLDQTDFNGVYATNRTVPVYKSIYFGRRKFGDDESFWRFVKQSAQDAGYYHLAGECFCMERCSALWRKFRGPNYETLSPIKKLVHLVLAVRLLPELIFGRLLFGYGERPLRVLAAIAIVILVCAIYYSQPGVLAYRYGDFEPSFFRGLYFSTITFTALSFGEIYPASEGFSRIIVMAEAVTGGFLMALFVVCMAKRFSRG
jgi:hypothetical protein